MSLLAHRRKGLRSSASLITDNLVGHWAADGDVYNTGTTQATDGQTVDTWVDASGQGNDLTVDDGAPPIFKEDLLGAGLHGVDFTPNDILHSTSITGLSSSETSFTVYIVAESDVTNIDGTVFTLSDTSASNRQYAVQFTGASTSDKIWMRTRMVGGFNSHGGVTFVANTPYVITAQARASNDREIWVNDASGATNAITLSVSGLDRFTLGAMGDSSPNDFFNGTIFEVAVYSVDHDATQRTEVYDVLSTKWGV